MNAYFLALIVLGLPGPVFDEAPLRCSVLLYKQPERNLVFEATVAQNRKITIKTPGRTKEYTNPKLEKEILKLATVSLNEIYELNRVILLEGKGSSLPLLDHHLFVRVNDENWVGSAVSTQRSHSSVLALFNQLRIAFPDLPEVKILQPDESVNGGAFQD